MIIITLTDFLNDTEVIVSSVSGMFTDILTIFMEPPLVVFIGLTIFASVVAMAKRLMHR